MSRSPSILIVVGSHTLSILLVYSLEQEVKVGQCGEIGIKIVAKLLHSISCNESIIKLPQMSRRQQFWSLKNKHRHVIKRITNKNYKRRFRDNKGNIITRIIPIKHKITASKVVEESDDTLSSLYKANKLISKCNKKDLTIMEPTSSTKSFKFTDNNPPPKNRNVQEASAWLRKYFPNHESKFANYSGIDLLNLTRQELIQFCGPLDGVRMYNEITKKAPPPKLVIYCAIETDIEPIWKIVCLFERTTEALTEKLSSVFNLSKDGLHSIWLQGPRGIRVLMCNDLVLNMEKESVYLVQLLNDSPIGYFKALLKPNAVSYLDSIEEQQEKPEGYIKTDWEIDAKRMTSLESKIKKSRLNNDGNIIITDSFECRVSPRPIVADEFIVDVPLRDAYIGILRNKKDTATVIKSLTAILPGFCHLKRCTNSQLLLAFVGNSIEKSKNNMNLAFSSESELKDFLNDKKFNLQLLKDDFLIVSVPEIPPRTKSQAKRASDIWPVNFHPDISIELILSGNYFNSVQLNIIDACMKVCIEASRLEAFTNNHCNGSAVILNPNDNGISRIISIASCRINEHPMWHAAMLAVDLVAKSRGGGAWKFEFPFQTTSHDTNECHKRKFHSIPPLCYPSSLNNMCIPEFSTNALGNSKSKHDNDNDNENNCPYLCTNYWVFLMEEPCPMCAMALLHSRVAMIFYGIPNKSRGILGSKALLHTMPGLNHRYKVWTNVLAYNSQRTEMKIDQRGQ
ncbi:hypothetical protein PV326_003939 [Microctonus aethiopoides]|nr:hypothetical protein PV326_003939 [Microctonus aethiopoides]